MTKYKYKLALSIVTANRPQHVMNGIRKLQQSIDRLGIGIYIFDGSKDSSIYSKVKEHVDNIENIYYFFYGSELESNYTRFYDRWALPDSEYIWTCADQRFPTPGLVSEILKLAETSPELMVINTIERENSATRKYVEIDKFFRDCCWHMQVMGANVIHKDVFKNSWTRNECKQQMLFEPAHTETRQILYALSGKSKGNYLFTKYFSNAYLPNIKKTLSSTIANDTMFLTFIDLVIKSTNDLPEVFDKYKAHVIKSMSTKTYWFTIDGFCNLKYLGVLHTKQCVAYYDKLKKVSFVPPFIIILISLLPRELAGLIRDWIRKGREWKNKKY